MRLRKGCPIRVIKESSDDSCANLVGALGIYQRNDHNIRYPLDILVGVSPFALGFDCCYQVERITEEEYIREYTLARLRGENAYSLEELREMAHE